MRTSQHQRRQERSPVQDVLFVILVLFLPFVAVGIRKGVRTKHLLLNVLLFIVLSPLAAVIHAFYILGFPPREQESCGYTSLDSESQIDNCCSAQIQRTSPSSTCGACAVRCCESSDGRSCNYGSVSASQDDLYKPSASSEASRPGASSDSVAKESASESSSTRAENASRPVQEPPAYSESENTTAMDNKVQSFT